MNKIPKGFKAFNYKDVRKNYYFINDKGQIMSKYGKILSVKNNLISLFKEGSDRTSYYSYSLILLNHNNMIPQEIDTEIYKPITYKNVKKGNYFIDIFGEVINNRNQIIKPEGTRVCLQTDEGKHSKFGINRLIIHSFGYTPDKIEGYKIIQHCDIKEDYYYINNNYEVMNKYGRKIKQENNNNIILETRDNMARRFNLVELIIRGV